MAEPESGLWVTTGADASVSYPENAHQLVAGVEEESPWYAERNRLVAAALAADGLPRSLLEVGAGNGAVAAHLRSIGVDAVAVEPARVAASVALSRGVPTVCGLLEDLGLPDTSLEAAGSFDVLEHLADPGALLSELRRVLQPWGRLVITVPAMPSLWSDADEFAHHHRRYRRRELVRDLEGAGFDVRSCRYAFCALVPAVGFVRALPHRLGRRRTELRAAHAGTRQLAGYGSLARAAARAAFSAERGLRRVADVPAGTSLIAVFSRRP